MFPPTSPNLSAPEGGEGFVERIKLNTSCSSLTTPAAGGRARSDVPPRRAACHSGRKYGATVTRLSLITSLQAGSVLPARLRPPANNEVFVYAVMLA